MKAKNAKALLRPAAATFKYIVVILAACVIFAACQKNTAVVDSMPQSEDLNSIAASINGTALEGDIVTNSDDSTTIILFNNGAKYVLIEKIPGMPTEDMHTIQKAVLITSTHGIVVKDVTNNKIFLLANNDEESLQKFEAIKQRLHCDVVSTTIFGTTIVNAPKS